MMNSPINVTLVVLDPMTTEEISTIEITLPFMPRNGDTIILPDVANHVVVSTSYTANSDYIEIKVV